MIVITIPAYNEEESIGNVIRDIQNVMDKESLDYKILVVDDGSKDKTAEIAKENGAIVFSHPRNLGLAEAFRTEIEQVLELGADIIVHTDADGQYPSFYIPQLIQKIKEGYDLVLGSRFDKGRYEGSFMKKIGNKLFSMVFSKLLKIKITDTTTGFRAFTKEVASLPLINSFTYTQEQLIRAGKSKLKIGEIYINTRKTRKSKLFKNPLDYAIKSWINIFRIYRDFAPLRFFGLFGLSFISIGTLIGIWLVHSFLSTGKVGHLNSTILCSLLIIMGIQILLFGFFADMIKK